MPVTAFTNLWAQLEQLLCPSQPQVAVVHYDAPWSGKTPPPHFVHARQRPIEVRRMLRQRSRLPNHRGTS